MAGFSAEFMRENDDANAKALERRTLSMEELASRFSSHELSAEGRVVLGRCRDVFKDMALYLDTTLPKGRPKSVALTELESCAMWASKAISEGYSVKDGDVMEVNND